MTLNTLAKFRSAARLAIVLLTFFFTLSAARAQKVKVYKAWVTLSNKEMVKGIVYGVHEDALVLQAKDLTQLRLVPEDIGVIRIRRSGKVGKGAWIGAISGLFLGGLIGFIDGDGDRSDWFYYTASEKALLGAMAGAPTGTLVGIVVGLGRKKYIVNGDREVYISLLPSLQDYSPQSTHDE